MKKLLSGMSVFLLTFSLTGFEKGYEKILKPFLNDYKTNQNLWIHKFLLLF